MSFEVWTSKLKKLIVLQKEGQIDAVNLEIQALKVRYSWDELEFILNKSIIIEKSMGAEEAISFLEKNYNKNDARFLFRIMNLYIKSENFIQAMVEANNIILLEKKNKSTYFLNEAKAILAYCLFKLNKHIECNDVLRDLPSDQRVYLGYGAPKFLRDILKSPR